MCFLRLNHHIFLVVFLLILLRFSPYFPLVVLRFSSCSSGFPKVFIIFLRVVPWTSFPSGCPVARSSPYKKSPGPRSPRLRSASRSFSRFLHSCGSFGKKKSKHEIDGIHGNYKVESMGKYMESTYIVGFLTKRHSGMGDDS